MVSEGECGGNDRVGDRIPYFAALCSNCVGACSVDPVVVHIPVLFFES